MKVVCPPGLIEYVTRQHGLFTTVQARSAGILDPAAYDSALVGAGVWQMRGYEGDNYERMLDIAALLEIDPTGNMLNPDMPAPCVVSHEWAASMWGSIIAVTAQTITCPPGTVLDADADVHYADLADSDVRRIGGVIPVTSPERTYADVAATSPDAVNIGRWIADMLHAGTVTLDDLAAIHPDEAVCGSPAEFVEAFNADVANW